MLLVRWKVDFFQDFFLHLKLFVNLFNVRVSFIGKIWYGTYFFMREFLRLFALKYFSSFIWLFT